MGRRKWYQCPSWMGYHRHNTHESLHLQALPKPAEADESNSVPFIDSEKEDVLIIRKIDPCISVNGGLHHTSKFELMKKEFEPSLVVRRGQSFRLDLYLSRPYREIDDSISFIFQVEDEEKLSFGQQNIIAIPLLQKPSSLFSWNAVLEKVLDDRIEILITPSPECIVAKWKMEVDTKMQNNSYSYSWYTDVYILYNPWCKSDQVYLKSEEWRDECILEDTGLIWRGTSNRLKPCIWKYGQFEKYILECSLYVIKYIGKVNGSTRADPVETARALAAAVNSIDDDGIIEGNWSNKFDSGTPPTKWVGSVEILQKFYKKKKPVKYGQCWVFSGALTTICRAVGIPARTITNYSSAHDTQSSLTVDYFLDKKGEIMEELISDSIWNFHVWNEVWMQRPDLGREYGGWQVIDATPQELSENMYRCGPTSIAAVKKGEIKRPYDCSFLFAEVNADKVFWRYDGPTQPLKLLGKDQFGIGKFISTKAAGKFEREDITHTYKYEENTHEERSIMLKALKLSESMFSRYYLNEDFNDIYFNFELRDDIKIGEPFNVSLVMRNKSKERDYKVSVILRVEVVTYIGKVGKPVKSEEFKVNIEKGATHELKLPVTYKEYSKRLLDQAAFNISCLATVEDTKFEYYAQDDFRVRKPDVKIILNDTPIEDQECSATAYISNSLPMELRKSEFRIEGPGITDTFKIRTPIPPGEKAEVNFKFKPDQFGKATIAAKFTSKELDDCDGYLNFWVGFKNESNEI